MTRDWNKGTPAEGFEHIRNVRPKPEESDDGWNAWIPSRDDLVDRLVQSIVETKGMQASALAYPGWKALASTIINLAPETPTYDPALVERMVGLVREMAGMINDDFSIPAHLANKAWAIHESVAARCAERGIMITAQGVSEVEEMLFEERERSFGELAVRAIARRVHPIDPWK